ncbi:MAG: hypothetical protein QOI82_1468 [Actinomycetota bacterium]|nr:hypothetical protein [Actinomycetota bacterium]
MELVGRDEETSRLRSFVDRTATRGEAMLVTGDAGVGKTVLLEGTAAYAEQGGRLVLRAFGSQFESDFSFGGLHQLLLPIIDMAQELKTEHQQALGVALGLHAASTQEQAVVCSAAGELLRVAVGTTPVLIVVDDLQWLDRPSALALGFLSRRITAPGLGLLAAARSGHYGYFDDGGLARFELQPLEADVADVLLRRRFPALASRVRLRLIDEAQGNPLALLELPAALTVPQRNAEAGLPAVLPLTGRLQFLFVERVQQLPRATRDLLLLAALEGNMELSVLQLVSDDPDLQGMVAAERAQLVSLDGRRLRFRHPLIRSAVVDAATNGERRRAHQLLAEALTDQPERRAWHLAEAALEPDEQVAALLESAARRTRARGDVVGAVAALLRAADLSPDGVMRGRRLAEAAYLGASATGDLNAVPRLLQAARDAHPEPSFGLAETVAAAMHLLNLDADLDTAHRLLAAAIEMQPAPLESTDDTLVEALHTLLLICFWGGRAELWVAFDAAFDRLRPTPPELLSLLRATFRDPVRTAEPALGRLDDVIDHLASATDPLQITRVGICAAYLDRLGGCRDALLRVVSDGRRGGAVASAIDALFLLANHAWFTGAWNEQRSFIEEGLDLCESNGYQLLAWPGLFLDALRAAARGDDETVRDRTDRMIRWAVPRQVGAVELYVEHVLALASLGRGDYDDAYAHAAAISPPGVLAPHRPHALWTVFELTEAAVHTGRRSEAAAHVAAVQDARVPLLSPRLALVTAGAAAVAADYVDYRELFAAALAVPGGARWPFDYARIQLAYGEQLRRDRETNAARVQLAGALEMFRRLDAKPWTARASQELRATGVSVGALSGKGPALLTPQQHEIATLAARGMTNREIGERLFLSPRTVGTHLYQLFPKLGITSRAALGDALRALSPDSSLEPPREPPVG